MRPFKIRLKHPFLSGEKMTSMQEAMIQRYSVKKFDTEKKISATQISELIECFRLSPSSLNLQAWKLVVVGDQETKIRLAEAGRNDNAKRIVECSHYLILMRKRLSLKHFQTVIESTEMLQLMMRKKKISLAKMKAFYSFYSFYIGPKKWSSNQLYIALGVLLTTCAKMGIGSLPMEGIRCRHTDKILGLPSEFRTVVALAIGYPHKREETNPSRLKKSRLPVEEVSLLI